MRAIINKIYTKKYLFISLLFLLLSTVFLSNYINSKRLIFYEADDNYHYLSKAVFLEKCKNKKCFLTNLLSKEQSEILGAKLSNIDRQIHRLTQSYHPLYTGALNLLIKFKDNPTNNQKILNTLIGFFIFLSIIFYVNFFFKNSLYANLIFVILAFHLYQGGHGIQFPIPFTLSIFLSAISIIFLKNKKSISMILFILSCLIHKIGILISCLTFLTYLANYFYVVRFNFKLFLKKQFQLIIVFSFLIIICFFISFTIIENNQNSLINLYSFDYNFSTIFESIKNNFKSFSIKAIKTIIYLNPVFLYFFLLAFKKNINDNFNILKIYTLILVLFMIFFPYGLEFAFGIRSWPLIVCNYLIIGFYGISQIDLKHYEGFLKKIYFFSLPVFLIINLYSLYNYSLYKIYKKNSYYNFSQISQMSNNNNIKTYFNSSEETFYFYLLSGFVNNDFYYKLPKQIKKTSYVVIDNPVNFFGSSIHIKNDTKLSIDDKIHTLILYSKHNQIIDINDQRFKLEKGKNLLSNLNFTKISNNQKEFYLDFDNILYDTRLLGIKLREHQQNFWPWGEDLNLEIKNSDFELRKPFIFSEKKVFTKRFNFLEIQKKIFSQIQSTCHKNIIYDHDSSIIILNKCWDKLLNPNHFEFVKKKVSQVFSLKIFKNNLYAASTFHNRIVKLDLEGKYLNFMNFYGNFDKSFEDIDHKIIFENYNKIVGKMTNVHSIDFDNEENMYISLYLPSEVSNSLGLVYAPKSCQGNCDGKKIRYFGGFKGVSHSYLDIDKKNLLVSDYGSGNETNSDIYIININDLNNRKKISDINRYKFKKPHMIRFKNNNYYAVDTGNNEIVVMDKDYKVVNIINNNFLEKKNYYFKNLFKTIAAVAFSDKFIFVSDVGNNSIFAFDYDWKLNFKIRENLFTLYENIENKDSIKKYSMLINDLELHSPFDLVYNNDRLYIANTHNDELIILKFLGD